MILNESLFEKFVSTEQLYKEIASQVRKEIVNKYGEDFLYGKCIEASEKIVALLSKEGINSKTVEGWVHYDCDEGCTDRDYDEHTWVETGDGYVIDVTATQFNSFMEEDYPAIIVSKELPYGYSYDEPDVYEDSDLDDWSYKNLLESKKRKKKKISQVKAGDPIFKSVNDMKIWVKKRQKGLSPFCYLNPNAGNVPLGNSIFNSTFSSDGSSGVGTSDGGISNGGLSVGSGDAGGGMGESLQLIEAKQLELVWYKTQSGNMPAKEFYDNCDEKIKLAFNTLFDHLKNHTIHKIPKSTDFLDKKNRIQELRVRKDGQWFRITFSYVDDCILLSGFQKYSNKTLQSEIELAINRKKDYLKYKNCERVIY